LPHKIAVVGGIRKDSINRKLAKALIKLMPSDLEGARMRIGDLPVFNQDNDRSPPEPVKRVKAESRQRRACCSLHPNTTVRFRPR
jgi:chromate reductase, NAD(P)H dehydrogenase (quinone)